MECQTCNDNTMYDRENGKRCAVCGWTWKPKTGLVDKHPTRAENSKCGDVIYNSEDVEGVNQACIRAKNCNDGTYCSVTPRGIKPIDKERGIFMVVCSHHQD